MSIFYNSLKFENSGIFQINNFIILLNKYTNKNYLIQFVWNWKK